MLELIFGLFLVMAICWIGFKFSGALLSIIIWLCFKLPFAIFIFCLGLTCCVTILLIPVGMKCFSFAMDVLM